MIPILTSLLSVGLAASTAVALPRTGPAALDSNIAYRSPSSTVDHAVLRVDTDEVYNGLGKRWADTYQGELVFPYGVASGDPYVPLTLRSDFFGPIGADRSLPSFVRVHSYSDSVILWTVPEKYQVPNAWPPICLQWVVSTSATNFNGSDVVSSGYVQTTEEVGFSVKVEATGLKPYTKYHYRFEGCEGPSQGVSKVGAFKTLPAEDDDSVTLRLATYSCSNLPFGFFNAYGHAANMSDSLDYVQHLGQYALLFESSVSCLRSCGSQIQQLNLILPHLRRTTR